MKLSEHKECLMIRQISHFIEQQRKKREKKNTANQNNNQNMKRSNSKQM